jgi:hypothetical protein
MGHGGRSDRRDIASDRATIGSERRDLRTDRADLRTDGVAGHANVGAQRSVSSSTHAQVAGTAGTNATARTKGALSSQTLANNTANQQKSQQKESTRQAWYKYFWW